MAPSWIDLWDWIEILMLWLWTQLKSNAEPLANLATAAGILIGSLWALYRFGIRRESKTALSIDPIVESFPYSPDVFLTHFDVALRNLGYVKIRAKRKRHSETNKNAFAYDHPGEKLKYSCSLLIRRLQMDAKVKTRIQWFPDEKAVSPLPDDTECDLLYSYEENERTDFWLEPGEVYRLSMSVVLERGLYLCMVTFVAQDPWWQRCQPFKEYKDREFWRRVFMVAVPVPVSGAQGS